MSDNDTDALPTTDSYKSLVINLFIGDEEIQIHKYFVKAQISYGLDTAYTMSITLFDYDWSYVESLLIPGTDVSLGIGFLGRKQAYFKGHLILYTPEFTNEGAYLTLDVRSIETSTVQQTYLEMSWASNSRPSDIVEELIAKYKTTAKWTGLIQKTKKVPRPFHIKGQPMMTFIKNELIPHSVPEDGTGRYRMWLDQNKLFHFHTRIYQPAGVSWGVIREYIFAKDQMGQVLSFAPSDLSAVIAQSLGGKALDTVGYDSQNKGTTNTRLADTERSDATVRKANVSDGQSYVNENTSPDEEKGNRYFAKPFRTKEELDRYTQSRFEAYAESTYQATLRILGDPFLFLDGYIRVGVLLPSGKTHYLSGIYQINNIVHDIEIGNFETSMLLTKRAAADGGLRLLSITSVHKDLAKNTNEKNLDENVRKEIE